MVTDGPRGRAESFILVQQIHSRGLQGPEAWRCAVQGGAGELQGAEVQDLSLPCVFSNSYTAPVLHSLPQPALSDKLQVQSLCLHAWLW